MNVYIIIPAYNEGSVILQTLLKVRENYPNVVVVDDGSIDNTYCEAKKSGAIVLRHIINRGQGASLRTGINYALKLGAEIVVTYDADGQFEPGEIKKVCQPVIAGEADIVLGSRFLQQKKTRPLQSPRERSEREPDNNNGGRVSYSNNIPIFKRLVLKSAIFFTRAVTGLKLTDTHNGFRAMNRKTAKQIKIYQDKMAHASEIVSEIARLNLRYSEVPITVKYTKYSKEKGQKITGAFRILFDLIVK